MDKKFKRDLIEFLGMARDWLIFVKCGGKKAVKDPAIDQTRYDAEDIPRTDELVPAKTTPFIHTQAESFFRGSCLLYTSDAADE